MKDRIILDLCGGTGNWSRPYAEAGYDVRIIDPTAEGAHAPDVRMLHYPGPVHGILAAPPCTVFSNAGARWKRSVEDYLAALAVADACLRLVAVCRPSWWALENPVGKLSRWIGPHRLMFQPCDYGDPWTKRTCLWGDFQLPTKTPVEPTLGESVWKRLGGKSERTKRLRSATPPGFARAFFTANP